MVGDGDKKSLFSGRSIGNLLFYVKTNPASGATLQMEKPRSGHGKLCTFRTNVPQTEELRNKPCKPQGVAANLNRTSAGVVGIADHNAVQG